ncbi:MAG: ABC transporter substrate-binding protein, partial [Lactobacillales bacterium]|nr:ABC transporter substrate-binding protein [Lactobacillales bacterium]
MKKAVYILFFLLFIGSVVFYYCHEMRSSDSIKNKPVVKIGAILPVTGELAEVAETFLMGARMAIDEVNILPDNKYFYELVVEDIGLDVKKAIPAYQKLKNIDGIDALVSLNSAVSHV